MKTKEYIKIYGWQKSDKDWFNTLNIYFTIPSIEFGVTDDLFYEGKKYEINILFPTEIKWDNNFCGYNIIFRILGFGFIINRQIGY